MNLRDFKKDVEYVIGDFVDDCTLFVAMNAEKGQDKIADLLNEALDLYNDLKDKAGRKFVLNGDKKAAANEKKAWFTGLRKELLEKTDALYGRLSAIVTAKED